MNPWYLVSCALLIAGSSASAFDHDLLSQPTVTLNRDTPIELNQQIRRRPALPDPDLHDGQRWLCSVGQVPEINLQAFRRAKAKGWGYWSFAPHAKCPPGIYLTVANSGVLKATGESVWTDEPSQGETLANYAAMPVNQQPSPISTVRYLEQPRPQTIYYALPGFSGFGCGFYESTAYCAACNAAGNVSTGATSAYEHAGWSYDGAGGGSLAGSSNGSCASCSGR